MSHDCYDIGWFAHKWVWYSTLTALVYPYCLQTEFPRAVLAFAKASFQHTCTHSSSYNASNPIDYLSLYANNFPWFVCSCDGCSNNKYIDKEYIERLYTNHILQKHNNSYI